MSAETISSIVSTLQTCTGSQYILSTKLPEPKRVNVEDLISYTNSLNKPSFHLNDEQDKALYDIAVAFIEPAINKSSSNFKCPAKPKEAVQIFKYLAGESPNELRGFAGVFGQLGLAYATGIGIEIDKNKSRKYYLIQNMYSIIPTNNNWSDGIDQDLVSNINRAGLRPYLEALAKSGEGAGTARLILADEALPKDAPRARNLLLYPDNFTLNRLIKLEEQGTLSIVADGSDIDVWAEAWRIMPRSLKWAARIQKSAALANGGSIPTSSERVSVARLRPYLDMERVVDAGGTQEPIQVRALVNRQGRAIYIEPCQQQPHSGSTSRSARAEDIFAADLYNVSKLPLMPISNISGRPAFGWVVLPAVHFQRDDKDKLKITFAELPTEQCAFPAVPVYVPPTLSPSNK
jgi:hypothetical protein